jgi:lysophospholipase L1-like esterase
MNKFLYRSYVAIGDSLTEGLGDKGFQASRYSKGWADRLAGILAAEANSFGEPFEYANLAVRGSSTIEILTSQLEDALRIKPDLVTIMAGANDIMSSKKGHDSIRALFRGAISRFYEAGVQVLIVNTVNPAHFPVFKTMARKSREMSNLIESIADEFEAPVLDIYKQEEFGLMSFWCDDLVHFSEHGHILIANLAAEKLAISHRVPMLESEEIAEPRWGILENLTWFFVHVLPFWGRRIRGVSSGDGLDPKNFNLELYKASSDAFVPFGANIAPAAIQKAKAKKKALQK